MKQILPAALILFLCSSCTVYQYNQLGSDVVGPVPMTFENDTLVVAYSVPNGFLNIEVFNKSEKPLYIDWTRSSMIIDGNPAFYWGNGFNPTLRAPVAFVPPGTRLQARMFYLGQRVKVGYVSRENLQSRDYTPYTSPMTFRSYLFMSLDDNFNNPITLDHSFWLSKMFQSVEPIELKPRNDAFISRMLID